MVLVRLAGDLLVAILIVAGLVLVTWLFLKYSLLPALRKRASGEFPPVPRAQRIAFVVLALAIMAVGLWLMLGPK